VYLAHGNYGFEAAAEYYFSRPVGQLTLPQAAMLAALIRGPGYSPLLNPKQALARPIGDGTETVLDALLAPHRCYLDEVRRLREVLTVKGLAHITGGGVVGNLPRILPQGLGARIQRGTWPEPEIFSYLAPFTPDDEMWRTFNMGLGMIVVADEASVSAASDALRGEVFVVGDIVPSEQRRVQIIE
jgi:phosphoribosylformylglycinamidine cyclo-ligase